MKLILPFTPHLANEILDALKCSTKNEWPKIEKNLLDEIKFAIQINGKTREIIAINKDLNQNDIDKIVKNKTNLKKYFVEKKIIKIIFVKNKIINYLIK